MNERSFDATLGDRPTWLRLRHAETSDGPRRLRARLYRAIRAFFDREGFLEVETPQLVRHPGMEPHLEVFQTERRTARGRLERAFLTTSPEYAMKKLLAAGIAPIYQICKSYRNGEESSPLHNPEFSILEWYRADAGYDRLMDDCERLCSAIAADLAPGDPPRLTRGGRTVELRPPWQRVTVRDAFTRYAGLDLWDRRGRGALAESAVAKGYRIDTATTWEQIYHQIFLNEVEPHLGQGCPTFLYEYPIELAALARAKPDDPDVAERFELYVGGVELANAFGELSDPAEQRRRLEAERVERRALGRTDYELDEDFLRALEVGPPSSAGIALGLDRLLMLFAGVESIAEVLWFPADEVFT